MFIRSSGATAALQDAPGKLAGFGETLRNGISSISFTAPSMESIRVAIPQQTVIRFSTKKEPTVLDELVAVRAAGRGFACHDLGAADLHSCVAAHAPSIDAVKTDGAGRNQRRHHEIPGALWLEKPNAPVKLASLSSPSDPLPAITAPASLSTCKRSGGPGLARLI